MEKNENLQFKEKTWDEFFSLLASEMQGDGQNNHIRLPQTSAPPPMQHLGPDYSNENIDSSFLSRRNVYFHDNYQAHRMEPMPFVMNAQPPREEVMPPGIVDFRSGDYLCFKGPQQPQNSLNDFNVNYMNKTNGTLNGSHTYGMEYPPPHYNLFSGIPQQMHPTVSHFSQHTEPNSKAQLIENLVGNWASDQSGTYSPFGTPLGGLRTDIKDYIDIDRGKRNFPSKTRIVAEVRPMRPSYSDVLTKSMPPNRHKQNHKKPITQDLQKPKISNEVIKPKPPKFSVGRTMSGNGNISNRQATPGENELNWTNKHNSSNKNTTFNKCHSYNKTNSNIPKNSSETYGQENLPKKWLSLDDLIDAAKRENNADLNEIKSNKKKNSKASNSKKTMPGKTNASLKASGGQSELQANSTTAKSNSAFSRNANDNDNNKARKRKIKGAGTHPARASSNSKNDNSNGRISEEKKASWKNQNQKSCKRSSRKALSFWLCPPKKHEKTARAYRKDQETCFSPVIKVQMDRYGGVLLFAVNWLLWLVLDVILLSSYLAIHMCTVVWRFSVTNACQTYRKLCHSLKNIEFLQRFANSRFSPFGRSKKKKFESESDPNGSGEGKIKGRVGLRHNISLPDTGEEAIKRLLACRDKDPYTVLGVTQDCTDDDIKKYYKRQAFLVHPDKNNQPGAEEAFKILTRAFNHIGQPKQRKYYDRTFRKSESTEEMFDKFLAQVQKKMELWANTIKCTNCKKRHKRTIVSRPLYAARLCNQCKIHHAVREGDIWAETSMFGLLWHYYVCMNGAVYDITEWGGCQGKNLRNLKANTHNVQYRMVDQQKKDAEVEELLRNFCSKTNSLRKNDSQEENTDKKNY